jgi:hypothetical protein
MSVETSQAMRALDPRTRLVREKYFCLRPKPLERWLWQQQLPQAAERVFWLHWEEGMRSRDWCSQLPLKRVARECCIDLSTVTRAYQLLKSLGLIRRQDPGRDTSNPFQQATAVTEVRIPKALLEELAKSPNRSNINRLCDQTPPAADLGPKLPEVSQPKPKVPSRAEIQATWGRASDGERSRYFNASRMGIANIEFDPDSQLSLEERGQLLIQLQQMANARSTVVSADKCVQTASRPSDRVDARMHRLSSFALARVRQRVLEVVAGGSAPEVLRQVVWAMEEGALRRFETPLALNIALKKIREGAWTRPNRMPPNWSRLAAQPETCSAA